MKMLRMILIVACVLGLISCGGESVKAHSPLYYPLEVGNQWTYQDTVQSAASRVQTKTVRVIDTTTVNGIQCHEVEVVTDGKMTARDFLALDESNVLCHKKETETFTQFLSPPLCQLRLPLKTGQEWDWQGDFPGIGLAKLMFTVEGQEQVDVPAGKFSAFKVVMKVFDKKTYDQSEMMRLMFKDSGSVKVELEPLYLHVRWFAENIGPVKETFRIKDILVTSELSSYSFGPRQNARKDEKFFSLETPSFKVGKSWFANTLSVKTALGDLHLMNKESDTDPRIPFLLVELSLKVDDVKLQASNVVLIDPSGKHYNLNGTAPFSVENYMPLPPEKDTIFDVFPMSRKNNSGSSISIDWIEGRTRDFLIEIQGKSAKIFLVYVAPRIEETYKLVLPDSDPIPIKPSSEKNS